MPLCPKAAEFIQRAPAHPSDLTASQRLIIPDVVDVESEDEYSPLEALQQQGEGSHTTNTQSQSQDDQLRTLELWATLGIPGATTAVIQREGLASTDST